MWKGGGVLLTQVPSRHHFSLLSFPDSNVFQKRKYVCVIRHVKDNSSNLKKMCYRERKKIINMAVIAYRAITYIRAYLVFTIFYFLN